MQGRTGLRRTMDDLWCRRQPVVIAQERHDNNTTVFHQLRDAVDTMCEQAQLLKLPVCYIRQRRQINSSAHSSPVPVRTKRTRKRKNSMLSRKVFVELRLTYAHTREHQRDPSQQAHIVHTRAIRSLQPKRSFITSTHRPSDCDAYNHRRPT